MTEQETVIKNFMISVDWKDTLIHVVTDHIDKYDLSFSVYTFLVKHIFYLSSKISNYFVRICILILYCFHMPKETFSHNVQQLAYWNWKWLNNETNTDSFI